MSETTTDTTPAITLRWRVSGSHSYRFELPEWREKLIGWFGLPADATDAEIVEQFSRPQRLPRDLLMELDELSAMARTWNDSEVDDVDDFDVHNVPGVPR